VIFILVRKWSKGVMQKSKEAMEANALLTEKLTESLSGIMEVKTLAGERREEEVAHERMATQLKKSISQSLYMLTGREAMALLGMIGGAITMLAGGYAVITEQFTIGGFFAFTAYVGRLYAPAVTFATTELTLYPSIAALKRVKEFFDLTEEEEGDIEAEKIEGEIEFKGVHFYYGDKKVLDGISLHIKPGERVAIVGPNGSGKTTMMRLLLGFFKPERGEILIDGIEAGRIKRLRERIGIVSQKIFLFNDTIENNIKYCKPEAAESEVKDVMERSGVSSFIQSLPLKERTPAAKLSGGQIQMIGIARVLLKDPDILIFDEANAHLDESSKETIKQMIKNEKRTCIIISHQRDFIDVADWVFEIGTKS